METAAEYKGAVQNPPPPPRTKWTRRVPHPVLSGHAASLTPYKVAVQNRARAGEGSPARAPAPARAEAGAGNSTTVGAPPPLSY